MKSWKTTLAGFVGTIGAALLAHNHEKWEWYVGWFFTVIFPQLLGLAAKDHDKTGLPETESK